MLPVDNGTTDKEHHLKRKTLALVLAVAAAASMATGLTANAFAADKITGAGSTLVNPLMQQWAQDYKTRTGTEVTYGSVGSGAGIAQITARSVDFGASDAPLKPSQQQSCNGCVQIPWALGAVAAAYHLDGVPRLKLTGKVLSEIYLGKITQWNASAIKKLNPGVSLPALKITPAFRSDGSGTTYGFTNYLWKVNTEWRSKVGIYATSVNFPAGVGGKGNDGVSAIVGSTNGAIGYVEVAYAIAHGLKVAAIQNAAGKFLFPNLKNIQAAGATVKHMPASNEVHIVNPSRKFPKAYPIATFTYAIVPHNAPQKAAVAAFVKYAVTTGQQFGPALDFAPIPGVVKEAALKSVNSL
jgi:phosphate transport system substrate-binding protein